MRSLRKFCAQWFETINTVSKDPVKALVWALSDKTEKNLIRQAFYRQRQATTDPSLVCSLITL